MVRSRLSVTELDDRSTQFNIEPLDPGFGYSLGNALRRVLLSSINGIAMTAVQIQGVQHEFDTLQGLREDITELILNLKECRFTAADDHDRWDIELDATKAGPITAGDFELPAGLELANSDLVIGHLDKGGSLQIRAVVERGVGFLPSETAADDPIGTIRLDANFSPIERVAYDVSAARVGQRTDYDKLELNVFTDGTRSPRSAFDDAVDILRETLDVLSPEQTRLVAAPVVEERNAAPHDGMESLPIEELELGVRAFNCLKADGVETLGDLLKYSERRLAAVPNFGKKSFQEVITALDERGLSLQDN